MAMGVDILLSFIGGELSWNPLILTFRAPVQGRLQSSGFTFWPSGSGAVEEVLAPKKELRTRNETRKSLFEALKTRETPNRQTPQPQPLNY